MARYIRLFINSFMMLGVMGSTHVLADEISALNDFADACGSFTLPRATAKFAPLEERIFLAKTKRTEDRSMRWSGAYQFVGSKEYSSNTITLGSKNSMVWLLRDFEIGNGRQERKESIDKLPPYIWHVISVPRKQDSKKNADGYMVLKREKFFKLVGKMPWNTVSPPLPEPSSDKLNEHLRRSYEKVRVRVYDKSTGSIKFKVNRVPTFNLGGANFTSLVNDFWYGTIGAPALRDFIMMTRRHDRQYDHTFYFQPIDKSHSIGPRARQEASSRTVHAKGTVFGFVIDHKGQCLASAQLQVKK